MVFEDTFEIWSIMENMQMSAMKFKTSNHRGRPLGAIFFLEVKKTVSVHVNLAPPIGIVNLPSPVSVVNLAQRVTGCGESGSCGVYSNRVFPRIDTGL